MPETAPAVAPAMPFAIGADFGAYIDSHPLTWRLDLNAAYGAGNIYERQTIASYQHSRAAGLTLWLGDDPTPVSVPGTTG
jgi:hypothetical protein